MIEVQEINRIEDLGDIRLAWHDLMAETAEASFFHSLEWLECYWKHFGSGQRLRILVVADRRRPIGIVPLVVRTESTHVGRVRTLTYPLHDWATFFGPLGLSAATALVAALRHIRCTPRDWDVFDLRWVDADCTDLGRTEQAMAQAGLRPCPQKWDQTSLVELSETWQDYWLGREAKFRRNIDRLEQRLAARGTMEFVRFRPNPVDGGSPRWDLYDTCVALAQRSWQGESGDKTNLCHGEYSGYFREAHAAAVGLGAADVNLLYIDGQPAAFMYNYAWKGAVYGLRKGFDPQFGQLRPGLVLQKMMLEDGQRRGDILYDLGVGGHAAKSHWRTSTRTSYRFTYFPASVLRAQLLWWNRWLRRQLRGDRDIACSQVV